MRRYTVNYKFELITKAFVSIVLMLLFSCNKEIENKLDLNGEVAIPTIRETEYKIAYLVIEGGVGAIVGRQATDYGKMPTLAQLALNSVFSWNSISCANKDLTTSYADMLTGVEFAKHQVVGSSTSGDLANYPTLFKRVKQYNKTRTALFTTNPIIREIVEDDVLNEYVLSGTDEEVTSNAIAEISKPDASIMFATFGEAYQAGEQYGYDSESYLDALHKVDNNLKSIIEGVKARPNYSNEKWLIVVASNRGGEYELSPYEDDGSIYSETSRNNFVVIHNNQFGYKNIERLETVDPAWTSTAVRYTGNTGNAMLDTAKSSSFDFGAGANAQDFTISLKLKVLSKPAPTVAAANGVIIGKHSNVANSSTGWSIIYNGHAGWRFQAQGGTVVDNQVLDLNTWYSLTAKIYKDGAIRRAKVFRNGIQVGNAVDITSRNLTAAGEALQFGYKNGAYGSNSGYSHMIADVRIYNTALPDEVITAYACGTIFYPSQPYYSNLMGYWPANDSGLELKDKTANNRHMQLQGSFAWTSFSERSASLCPTLPENIELHTIRSVDAPRAIYNWLNIIEASNFNLDAQLWSPSFVKK